MAQNAHKEAEKKMSLAREQELAAMIMQDIERRRQNAEENGVLAYAKRPIPRGRPNERFLQNTLKNLDTANRREQENQLWRQYTQDKDGPRGRGQKRGRTQFSRSQSYSEDDDSDPADRRHSVRSRSDRTESRSTSSQESLESSDEDVGPAAVSRPVRGRGTVGSKADDLVGPFLVPADEDERKDYDDERYQKRKALGPERPEWLVSDPEPLLPADHRSALPSIASGKAKGTGKSKEKGSKKDRRKERKKKSKKESKDKRKRHRQK